MMFWNVIAPVWFYLGLSFFYEMLLDKEKTYLEHTQATQPYTEKMCGWVELKLILSTRLVY